MSSALPQRIREIMRTPPEQRTAKQRRRLAEWERQDARTHLSNLEHDLHVLADAIEHAGRVRGLYHDPRHPVFSKECRMGRPDLCHWYPCCNVVHTDPQRTYRIITRRLHPTGMVELAS